MKYLLTRLALILGIPTSIICLLYGFWLFTSGIMTYPLVMMIYGFVFWFFVFTKMPRQGIRKL